MVLLDGTVVEIGGKHLDSAGYDLLGLICGSEGQLGIVTEATVRILRAAEGARPALMGFDSAETAGACVAAIIGAGIIPVAMEYMDRPAIEICEAFAHAGYPLDVEAMLIIEVEGSEAEIEDMLEPHRRDRQALQPEEPEGRAIGGREPPRSGRAASPPSGPRAASPTTSAWTARSRPASCPTCSSASTRSATATASSVANVFHAGDGNLHPLIMFDINKPGEMEKAEAAGEDILKLCVEVGGCLTGEHGVGIEKRDLMTVQFDPEDLAAADARARRVRSGVAAQPRQGVPAGGTAGGLEGCVVLAWSGDSGHAIWITIPGFAELTRTRSGARPG